MDETGKLLIRTPVLYGSRSVNRKDSWWDAAIAAKVIAPFADKRYFVAYADIDAGGSDLSYQLLAWVNWQFSHSLSAKCGYRHLYQDYTKDDIKWDMTPSGTYLDLASSSNRSIVNTQYVLINQSVFSKFRRAIK